MTYERGVPRCELGLVGFMSYSTDSDEVTCGLCLRTSAPDPTPDPVEDDDRP